MTLEIEFSPRKNLLWSAKPRNTKINKMKRCYYVTSIILGMTFVCLLLIGVGFCMVEQGLFPSLKNYFKMSNPTTRKIISSADAPQNPLPLSQGVKAGNTLYVSGQLGITTGGDLVEGLEAQTRLTLDNIGHILKAAGTDFPNVVKVTVLLQNISDFSEMNKVYGEYFKERFPARVAYQVGQLPRAGALVEIDAIAIVGDIKEED